MAENYDFAFIPMIFCNLCSGHSEDKMQCIGNESSLITHGMANLEKKKKLPEQFAEAGQMDSVKRQFNFSSLLHFTSFLCATLIQLSSLHVLILLSLAPSHLQMNYYTEPI